MRELEPDYDSSGSEPGAGPRRRSKLSTVPMPSPVARPVGPAPRASLDAGPNAQPGPPRSSV
ncbi:hypothetical protein ACWCPI_35115 [Streptomyces sp. NPDC001920]